MDRLPALAAELVAFKPDVIVTTGTPGTRAAIQATKSVPIVITSSGDAVTAGLVASYSEPGGNVTGLSVFGPDLEGKRMALIKEAVPRLARVAVIWNSGNPAKA
jgi:putative ABC transport system substrate-binding protein